MVQLIVRIVIGVTNGSGQLMIAAGTAIGDGPRSTLCLPGGVANVCDSNQHRPTVFTTPDDSAGSAGPRCEFERPSTRKPPTARVRYSSTRGDRIDRDPCFELLENL